MELKFIQMSAYAEPWEVLLQNIPNDAILYKNGGFSDKQQNWCVFIPTEVFNPDLYEGDMGGKACQVRHYTILEWSVIYLHDITPIGEWVSEVEKYHNIIVPFLKTCYRYEHFVPKYEHCIDENGFLSIEKVCECAKLVGAHRLYHVDCDDNFLSVRVSNANRYTREDNYSIEESTVSFYKVDDDMLSENTVVKLTHDSKEYDECFDKIVNTLKIN